MSINQNFQKTDHFFMAEALKEAKKAFLKEEVPIGAVLVHNQKIIARGHNQVEMLKDATAHAEMICLTAASSYFNNWRLKDTTMYCTLEPCCMCAGAMLSSRIHKLVWATKDMRLGVNGSWFDLFNKKHPMHEIIIEKGIMEKEASELMKLFFENQRKKKIC